MSARRSAWLPVGLALAATSIALASLPSPYRFEATPVSSRASSVAVVDVLGNAVDDLAVGLDSQVVLARLTDRGVTSLYQQNFEQVVQHVWGVDVNEDGLEELAVSLLDSTGARLEVFDRFGRRIATLGPIRGPGIRGQRWNGEIRPIGTVRTPSRTLRLACLIIGVWREPRAVVAFDLETSHAEWTHDVGTFPAAAEIVRAEGHTVTIIVTTSATSNGVESNDTDDKHSYLIALGPDGTLAWRILGGNEFSKVFAAICDGPEPGSASVVLGVRNERGHAPAPGRLAVLDAATGVTRKEIEIVGAIGAPRIVAGRPTRVCLSVDGRELRVYDMSLTVLARREFARPVAVWASADLNGDGNAEIIASTPEEVLVLDERLATRGAYRIATTSPDPVTALLARSGLSERRVVVHAGSVLALKPVHAPPWKQGKSLALALSFGMGVGAVAWKWPRGKVSARTARLREFLLDYLKIEHDVFDQSRPFEKVRLWIQQWWDEVPFQRDGFHRARHEFLHIGAPSIERFLDRAQQLGLSEPDIRQGRASLERVRGLLEEPPQDRSRAGRLMDTVNALSESCRRVYLEAASRRPCRVDLVVQEALLARQHGLSTLGVEVGMTCEPSASTPALGDPEDLKGIVVELLDNAGRQLRGSANVAISVSVALDPLDFRWIRVSVADNGPGIPTHLREEVFSPKHSSRASGGLGLAMARDLARRWGGELRVEPTPGGGATLVLFVRVLRPSPTAGSV